MRKLFLILLCVCLLLSHSSAASDEITMLDAQVTVDSSGISRVTVMAQVRFVSRPTRFVFPLGTDAEDITAAGAAYEEDRIDGVEYIIFENESGFSGTLSFQCSYTLPCTMTESDEEQHFFLELPERGWELPINRFQLTVTFPSEITAFPRWHSSYYGDVIDNYLNIQIKENTVTADSAIVFRDHETLSMELDFQPNTFVLRHLAEQTVPLDRIVFLVLYGCCILYWILVFRRKKEESKKLYTLSFQASAGEIPCQLYGILPDAGALLAHWGNLGYILLHRTRRGSFRIEKQMEMGNERSAAERRVFKAIFRSTAFVEVPGSRFLTAFSTEAPVLRAHWRNRMFKGRKGRPKPLRRLCLAVGLCLSLMMFDTLLPATPSRWFWLVVLTLLSMPLHWLLQQITLYFYRPQRWLYMLLGTAAAFVLYLLASPADCGSYLFFHLLLQLGVGYVTRFGGGRSVPGQETVEELMSFRKFVTHANRESAKTMVQKDGQYFFRALPYAEMLGIGNRFVKHFGAVSTEACPWLVDEKNMVRSPRDFYSLYKEMLRQLRMQDRISFFRSLGQRIVTNTPRVRPGNDRGRSKGSSSYKNKARRPASRSDNATSRASNRRRTTTRRTQHRANTQGTVRR